MTTARPKETGGWLSRERGQAMVDLGRVYEGAGFRLAGNELPDYLPAVLEFAELAPQPGRALLAELREPIELVGSRLRERRSRYAVLLDAVLGTLPALTRRQAAEVRRLAEAGPPSELVGLEPSRLPVGLEAGAP